MMGGMKREEDTPDPALRAHALAYSRLCGEYVNPAERERLASDWERKAALARGVVFDFKRRAMEGLTNKELLDVGFGNGVQLAEFARQGARMHGLEVNEVLHSIAKELLADMRLGADMRLYDGGPFPYEDEAFDGGYSVSVLEHVSDPRLMLREIGRTLKKGARFYLAFPNRYAPRETHTRLYFLSYLPRSWAKALLELFGRSTIDDLNLHFISYPQLRGFLRGSGLRILFEYHRGDRLQRTVKRVLAAFGVHHSVLLPHIMVVLEKVEHPRHSGILLES